MQALESLLQSNTTPEFKALVTDMVLKFAGERPEEKSVQTLIQRPSTKTHQPQRTPRTQRKNRTMFYLSPKNPLCPLFLCG